MCVCFIYVKCLEVWTSVIHLRISVEGTANPRLEILNECVMHWDRYTRVTADRENWNRGERRR